MAPASRPWIEVRVSVGRAQAAIAEDVLERLGALAITFEDDADEPVLEPDPGSMPLWPSVHIRGLFDTGTSRQRITEALQFVPGLERPDLIRWREVGDQDWERAWMEQFRPMKFGQSLWIVPTGMQIPFANDNIEIRLDPGLAFGTGTHPTTALCLDWLDGQDLGGRRVVDYGCGSGILGIAAALKGAERVICVDNDPQALDATQANTQRNGVADTIECMMPDEFDQTGVDVLLANILSGPLIALSTVLLESIRIGGKIVLSGVLEEQSGDVIQAYRPACSDFQSETTEGWVRLQATKL
jgi:ribosomal protein L11 methyltransferase